MKTILAILVFLCILLITLSPISAEGEGRYQAYRMYPNVYFILDTKEGHIWKWYGEVPEKYNSGLYYEGKVKPGTEAVQFIFRSKKASETDTSHVP